MVCEEELLGGARRLGAFRCGLVDGVRDRVGCGDSVVRGWALSLYPEAGEGGGCLVGNAAGAACGWCRRTASGPQRRRRGGRGRRSAATRRESAEPARHADLPRARAAMSRCGCARDLAGFFRGLRGGDWAGAVSVCVGAAVASGRARSARALRGRPLRAAQADRAGLGARVRAHQAARRAAGRLGRARRRRGSRPATWPATSGASSRTSAGWRGCIATRSRRAFSRRRSSATAARPRT